MALRSGMLLYHGSYTKIEQIDLELCADGKDFGKGFYLSDDLEQAKSFIPRAIQKAVRNNLVSKNTNRGYVSVFRYTASKLELPIYQFESATREWLWFVSLNRRESVASFLRNKIEPEALSSPIIIGKIANDTTNPTITAWLSGFYGPVNQERSAEIAIELLLPNRLKTQYCFKTPEAIACLTFQEYYTYDV